MSLGPTEKRQGRTSEYEFQVLRFIWNHGEIKKRSIIFISLEGNSDRESSGANMICRI